MSGYEVAPDELDAFAHRLADTADELRAVVSALAEQVGDLGPEGIPAAVSGLFADWADTLRALDPAGLSDELRAAGETYRQADELNHG